MELLLSFLAMLALYILRSLISAFINKLNSKNTNASTSNANASFSYCREPDLDRVRKLTDEGMKRLSDRGLERLMLDDYTFKTKVSSQADTSLAVIRGQLQSCLNEILFRFHVLPVIKLEVVELDGDNAESGSAMGIYLGDKIKLQLKKTYTPKDIMHALCHESVHYLLHYLNINGSDTDMDEGLTEVVCCLAGFSNTMIASNANRYAPYLIDPEFREVKRLLLSRRPELLKADGMEKARQSAMAQLKKNCKGALDMISLAGNFLETSTPSASLSKEQFAAIQKTMLAFETGDYTRRIQKAEQIKGEDLQEVLDADEDVMRICGEIFEVLQAYR